MHRISSNSHISSDQLQRVELHEVVATERELGRGSYGRVVQVKVYETSCAAKEVHAILLDSASAEEHKRIKRSFLAECINCCRINHPNVVHTIGVYYPTPDTELPWLVMELMHTSLTQFLTDTKQDTVKLNTKLSILVGISKGLQYLHSQDILHRDLTSNNILLTKDLVAKIADLGVAKVVKQSKQSAMMSHTMAPGGPEFMPPEALTTQHYGKPVDVFSLGCVACHVMSHQWPRPNNQFGHYSMFTQTEVKRREKYLQFCTTPALKKLVEQCLDNEPGKRPDASVISRKLNIIAKEMSQASRDQKSRRKEKHWSLKHVFKTGLRQPRLPFLTKKVVLPGPAVSSDDTASKYVNKGELLEKACSVVDKAALDITHSMDNNQLKDVLQHASTILSELGTSQLSPKNYFNLFTHIFHQLDCLDDFITNELVKELSKESIEVELDELVQHINIDIARLYLLITVSMAYVKLGVSSEKDTLMGLTKLCCQVQHPLRGLFLRYYLLQCTKTIETDDPESEINEVMDDSVDFILANFSEMNKLSQQYQGSSQKKKCCKHEERQLHVLVGMNIARLSQLQNIDVNKYKNHILHYMMEQVIIYQNVLVQGYLMDCIIQAFPDEYHLETLDILFNYFDELHIKVNMKTIIVCLINHIATYAHYCAAEGKPVSLPLFDMFLKKIIKIVKRHSDMLLEDTIAMLISLINLAVKLYPDHIDYVDKVLHYTFDLLQQPSLDHNNIASEELIKLLMVPLENYEDTLCVLQLEYYPKVLQLFDYQGRKQLAVHLATTIVEKCMYIATPDALKSLFNLLSPLIQDQSDQPKEPPDPEDLCEEQWLMAKLIHLLKADVADQQYKLLQTAQKMFGKGSDQTFAITLPPVVFAAYRLVRTYQSSQDDQWRRKAVNIFIFCCQTIYVLDEIIPEMCLKLLIQGALTADQIQDETSTYDFLSQAMSLCEEDALDNKAKCDGIMLIVSAVEQLTCLGEESLSAISKKLAVICCNLAEKADQCRGVALCAHLFWSGKVMSESSTEVSQSHDGKRVVKRLRKSDSIAVSCEDSSMLKAQLLVELLNSYMYFYEQGNEEISPSELKQLIEKIKETITRLDDNEEAAMIKTHFANTIAHIKSLQSSGDSSHYDGIGV